MANTKGLYEVSLTHTHTHSSATHMLPLLSDQRPVSKKVFQREVVDVRPGGRAVPGYLQPPSVEADRGRRHALRGVWFDCGMGKNKQSKVSLLATWSTTQPVKTAV